jgi:hypothetical protein
MLHGEEADGEFHGAGRTQHVPVLGLGTADGYSIGRSAEGAAQGCRFHRIARGGRGAMGVDVGQVVRLQAMTAAV